MKTKETSGSQRKVFRLMENEKMKSQPLTTNSQNMFINAQLLVSIVYPHEQVWPKMFKNLRQKEMGSRESE